MSTGNEKSIIIPSTIEGIDGFLLNMSKRSGKGMHVKECGNMQRSFIGPYTASTNLYNGWRRISSCCIRRAWDRLWPVIKKDTLYLKIVAEDEKENTA